MTYQEILEILTNPENSKVEYKLDSERPEKIAKEIVAFANFRGGRMLFGVEDATREIKGLTRHNFEEWLMDTVFGRYITPSIIPFYEEVITPDDKKVGILTVEQGISKPYYVKDGDRLTPYIRIGSISKMATSDQLLRMAQESGYYHFEIAPVSGSTMNDIDLELFNHFYEKEYYENLNDEDFAIIQQKLNNLDLLVTNSFGGISTSIAGNILFGKNPAKFLPQYGFRIIAYHGIEVETDHLFDVTYALPLANIFNENQLLRSGLVEVVLQKLSEVLSSELLVDNVHRQRIWKIPERVLRELTVNAIIHRDYTKKGKNEIRIFKERIEIESQGALPNTLTVEKIIAGQKYPRNPILVQFAQYIGLMEHKGLGIRKIVMAEMRKLNLPEPQIKETEDTLTVVLYYEGNK
jgi:ATP-dependent DNA helicase RecG